MARPSTNPTPDNAARPTASTRARLVDLGLEAVSLSMMAFIASGLFVWSGRREISRELAESWLSERGIEAAVQLEDVDATGFVGKVRLGPRSAPIFAAERLEVAYDLSTPWSGGAFGIQTKAVRLVRPRIAATLDDKGLRFGALQPLIDEALKAPRRPEVPGPAVLIEGARLDLTTPGGRARITGDASLDDGQLRRLDARLAPLRYAVKDLAIDAKGATVSARKRGDRRDQIGADRGAGLDQVGALGHAQSLPPSLLAVGTSRPASRRADRSTPDPSASVAVAPMIGGHWRGRIVD